MKLFDSELKVMEMLWKHGDLSAGQMAKLLKDAVGWNRNTTYTVIKKCIDKGAITRHEPNFMCQAAISKDVVRETETNELIDKMFDGSRAQFFAAFLSDNDLSEEDIRLVKAMLNEFE